MGRIAIAIAIGAGALAVSGRAGERIAPLTFTYRTAIRGETFAEEAETITNPLHWPLIKYVVPDGAHVDKGDIITEFDREGILNLLENLDRERDIVKASLALTLTEIRNRDAALHDELQGLDDQLAVLRTQLTRYRALPEPDDVAIAQGRLTVARLELGAAEKDLETARGRFERGMISPGERDGYEKTCLEARARAAYREGMWRVASQPAPTSTVRRTELTIENAVREREKLLHEIERNAEISEIERGGAKAQVDIIENRIQEATADLKNAVIRAPISGYAVHLPTFRQSRGQGTDKMWKNFAFLRIPNQDTIAVKGVVLEVERRFFKEGDPVRLVVAGHPDEPLNGEIASFSALSHDRGEREEERWRRTADSGIMVYDVVIHVKSRPDWLRVGLSVDCDLTAGEATTAPAIPATFVKMRNGVRYLAFNGVYEPVEGTMVDGYFVLDDPELEGREVGLLGRFRDELQGKAPEPSGGLRVSGELVPADTADVVIADIYHWQKVSWLVPEDSHVKKGDVIARLDSTESDEAIVQAETQLKQASSRREREQEELKLRQRENGFNLARASNLCEVARLDLADLLDRRETAEGLKYELDLALARIRLEFLERELKRIEGTRASAFSPLEIAELKRDRERAALQLEAAQVHLDVYRAGPKKEVIAKAEFAYLDAQMDVSDLRKKLETDTARKNYDLRRAEREERRQQDALDERRLEKDNLTIVAPRDGLARYGKVQNSGVWSKVAPGSLVTDRVVLMKIADVSRMYMRLEIPERYYTSIARGMRVRVNMRSLVGVTVPGTVSEIEFLFRRKRPRDTQSGLYSSHEALGETVFYVRVEVDERAGVELKPGAVADVIFPFSGAPSGPEPGPTEDES